MILVTGANGLLGSFICRKLIEKGEAFKALKRAQSDLSLLEDLKGQIEWVEGSLSDLKHLEEVLAEIDTVIHCAAVVSFDPSQRDAMFQANVEGTRNLVNTCLSLGIEKFIHISSIAAIGRTEDPQNLIDENNKWVDSKANSIYAQTKHQAELEVWRAEMEGMKTLILNPSVILGPGDWHKSSAQIFKYIWDESVFYPAGSMNYVDIRDVTEALYLLHQSGIHGERFIVNAGEVNYKEFLELIARFFKKKAPYKLATKRMLAVARWADKIRALLTGSKPLITEETARLADKAYKYDNQKLLRTVDFQYRPLAESVEWTCDALRKRYKSS